MSTARSAIGLAERWPRPASSPRPTPTGSTPVADLMPLGSVGRVLQPQVGEPDRVGDRGALVGQDARVALGRDGLPGDVLGQVPVDRAALVGHQVGELPQRLGELLRVAERAAGPDRLRPARTAGPPAPSHRRQSRRVPPEPPSGSSPGSPGRPKPKGGSFIAVASRAGWRYHIGQAIPGALRGERPSSQGSPRAEPWRRIQPPGRHGGPGRRAPADTPPGEAAAGADAQAKAMTSGDSGSPAIPDAIGQSAQDLAAHGRRAGRGGHRSRARPGPRADGQAGRSRTGSAG